MTARPKVLVVDDELPIRRCLLTALTCEGYDVLEAVDGIDALDKLQRSAALPHLMLLDLRMPRMDGRELLRIMQDDARLRALPVIALSATFGTTDVSQLDVVAYFDKPFSLDALLDTIAATVKTTESAQELAQAS
jgi:chemosensory pili system protein ChpA (sensor histidine kinase/response regulator)